MKMKILMGCMLLFLTVWTPLHLLGAEITPIFSPIWYVCGNTKYIHGDDFHRNLNLVLESLMGNTSTSGFSTYVKGQNKYSTVYGFFQCRPDFDSSDCKSWAFAAKISLLQKCQSTSGFIFIDGYILRYDNHNFQNDYNESSKFRQTCSPIVSAMPEQFGNTTEEVLSKLIEKTVQSHTLWATDIFETGYPDLPEICSRARCWDLSQTNCRSCLDTGRSIISGTRRSTISSAGCESRVIGASYLSMNCILRYEVFRFFNASFIPLRNAPPPGESHPVSGVKMLKLHRISFSVVAVMLGLIAATGLWMWNCRRKPGERIFRSRGGGGEINLSPTIANPELIINYDILREAASNFNEENKLGQGGFGFVFKGVLPDGREVAIKRLNIDSRQGDTEFLNEANLISRVQHRNLVKLLGCSVKGSERLLVYEYLQNGSLNKILFGYAITADRTKRHLLDWSRRFEIIVGTARGLAYLHEESEIRIIHRDIKGSNILLDNKYRPKIADFGLAKLFGEDQSHVSTRIAGTFGYMAPEYAFRGQLTEKADVFSFGVVVLEIISGRKNQSLPQHTEFLFEAIWRLYKEERTLELMDPSLEGSYSCEEAMRVIKIGLLCTQAAAALRPTMSRVVWMLTSEQEQISSPTRPAFVDVESVDTPHQIRRPSHSGGVDPSSGTLEPR